MSNRSSKPIEGVAVLDSKYLSGYVKLKENKENNTTNIQARITGLKPNRKYAWHIHEAGDLRTSKSKKACSGACAHYNPHHKKHGGPRSKERHVGDLGNLTTNAQGESRSQVTLSSVKLRGKYSVIGRSIVIHALEDDLGRGGTIESSKTGSAGARIACGVIGYSDQSQLYF